jgi:hypothetical protein
MPNNNFYKNTTRTEIDMRKEMTNFLQGSYPEIAKKMPAILRRMRRTTSGTLTDCACVDDVTGEPDKDTFCGLCFGEGYYWDEIFLDVYKVVIKSDVGNALKEQLASPSLWNIPVVLFYTDYAETITEDDKIVELSLNTAGEVVEPYQRVAVYRINTLFDFRADEGRLEYYKIATYKEDVKFLNGPNG